MNHRAGPSKRGRGRRPHAHPCSIFLLFSLHFQNCRSKRFNTDKANKLLAAAETKMAGRHAAFLENAWAKEAVLVMSFTTGGLDIILPPQPLYQISHHDQPGQPLHIPSAPKMMGTCPVCPASLKTPQSPSLQGLKKL